MTTIVRRPLLKLALATLLLSTTAATPHPPASAAPRTPASAAPRTPASAAPRGPGPATARWTDETPDAMVDDAKARATASGATEADVLGAVFVLHALEPRAQNGRAEAALREIASKLAGDHDNHADLGVDIQLLARSLSDDEGTSAGTDANRKLGVLTELSILGPFRDTGGGLSTREGPEAEGGSFADMKRPYAWGTVDVSWRQVPPHYATAGGVPMDLFISPRTESCSYVASAITVPSRQSVVIRVAASGSVRLLFDGADLAHGEDVESSALVDRLAVQVDATPGSHLVAAKVCTGALADDGRIRLRLTDPKGAALHLGSTADLSTLAPAAASHHTGATGNTARSIVLRTPLTQLLARRTPTTEILLEEAIARTFGGADDLRSPRAPGLLADLGRHAELDADQLALIGWISPFGANRSSILNRARALSAGVDPRIRAFAERRLIAQRMNSHLVDWALATAIGAHLGHEDSEAVLLHALIDDALGTDALRTAALRNLTTFAAHEPGLAPTVLLRELCRLAATYDPAELRATNEVLAARGYRGHELVASLGTRSTAALVQAAKNAFDGNLSDAEDGLAVADSLARAGRHEEAKWAYGQMTAWAPNRSEAWIGLAHELSFGQSTADVAAQSSALRRARELVPADASLRAEVAMRQSDYEAGRRAHAKPSEDATAREDEKYLVAPDVFLSRRLGVSATGVPDVADRELYWLRAVVFHPDRRVSQLIQYAREVVIPPRTPEELNEDLPAEGDLTEILRARVHRKGGGIAFPTEQHDEGSTPSIRWPELEPGDTVEVAIRTWTHGAVGGRGDAPFYFIDYAGAPAIHPLFYNEVVVEAPKSAPLYLDVLHGDPDRKSEHDDGDKHITRLVWDHPAVIPDEPLAPKLSEVAPLIVGSTFKDWSAFRTWYTGAVEGFSVPDDEVRRLAESLTRGKTTRDAKLAALFDFVADDIRYVNFTSGEGWLPNRPQQLLARREGDCDDKALLLITLLRAVGIEAQQVLLQTREEGQPSTVEARRAVVPMFDHGIAFLPGPEPGGGQYLDATSPESRLGPLPSMDARAPAFRIQAGPAEISRLPASSPADHGSDVRWSIALHADGSGDLVGEEQAVGDSAFWLRSSLTEPDARADYVRDHLVSPWLPTVVVDKKVDFDGELARGRARVKYTAHAAGIARHEAFDLTLSVGQSQGYTSALAPLVSRTLAVVLPPQLAPSHQERTTRFTAPPGFAWPRLPDGGDENGGDFGRAHLDIVRDPRDPRTARYPLWRAWLQRVDRLMHKDLRLVETGRHE